MFMKIKLVSFVILITSLILLTGCESTGWQWSGAPDIFTPGANAETKVRTWDNEGKPHEKTITNEPAFLYDSKAESVQK